MNWPDRDLPPKVLENLDAKIELFMSQKTALDNEEGMSKVKKILRRLIQNLRGQK